MPGNGRTLNILSRARAGTKKNAAARCPLIADCLALPTPGQIFGDDTKEALGSCLCLESTEFCHDAVKRAADSEQRDAGSSAVL